MDAEPRQRAASSPDQIDPVEPIDAARPNRRMRAATILAVPALLALAASAALFVVPVTNPGVQDCGSPAWFLLRAQTDRPLIESDGTGINGWKTARLQKAHDDRCSVQVARRAVPAGSLLVVFWVLGGFAIVLGWTGRRSLRRTSMVQRT